MLGDENAKSGMMSVGDVNAGELPKGAGTLPKSPKDGGLLNMMAYLCHQNNKHWWHTEDGVKLDRNKGELLMLIVSEIAEAMEGERKDLMDDKIPTRKMAEVELADALIRIFDYAGAFGYDLSGAFNDKMAYNAIRADHTYAARKAEGGKKF